MSAGHHDFNIVNTLHHDIYPSIDPLNSDLSQPGKVVLITGAGRGIGQSIALHLAKCHISSIYLCSRTLSELSSTESQIKNVDQNIQIHKFPLDVSNETSIKDLVTTISKTENRLDVIVNNAGFSPPLSSLISSDTDEYWNTFVVNLKGPYMLIKNLLPIMLETAKNTGKVDVINMSSVGANMVRKGPTAYLQSKFALTRLSEFVALEHGEAGVNCISLHPGVVRTRMNEKNAELQTIDSLELPGGFVAWFTKGDGSWLNGRYVSATWDVDELQGKKKEIVEKDLLKMKMAM